MITAHDLANSFYTQDIGEDYPRLCTKDELARDMVHAADDAGLGWNFAYEAVRDCLQWIDDTGSDPRDSDTHHEAADSLVDVYNADLIKWLADAPLAHYQLCDEAFSEYASDTPESIIDYIRIGQYEAYRRAMQAIADNWPDDTEEDEDEDDEA